jgi:hypothetical protein
MPMLPVHNKKRHLSAFGTHIIIAWRYSSRSCKTSAADVVEARLHLRCGGRPPDHFDLTPHGNAKFRTNKFSKTSKHPSTPSQVLV